MLQECTLRSSHSSTTDETPHDNSDLLVVCSARALSGSTEIKLSIFSVFRVFLSVFCVFLSLCYLFFLCSLSLHCDNRAFSPAFSLVRFPSLLSIIVDNCYDATGDFQSAVLFYTRFSIIVPSPSQTDSSYHSWAWYFLAPTNETRQT